MLFYSDVILLAFRSFSKVVVRTLDGALYFTNKIIAWSW